jgi:hypothetical protein
LRTAGERREGRRGERGGIERGREGIGGREKEAGGLCRGRDGTRLAEREGMRIDDVGLGSERGMAQFLEMGDAITRP